MTCMVWSETGLSPTYHSCSLYRASYYSLRKLHILIINRWHAVSDQKLDFYTRTTFDIRTEHHNYSLRKLYICTFYKSMTCSVWSETGLFILVQHLIFVQSITITRCGNYIYVLFIHRWHAVTDHQLDFHPRTTSDLCTEHHNYSLRKLYICTFYTSMTCSVWSETGLSPTYNIWYLYRASQLLVAEIIYMYFL